MSSIARGGNAATLCAVVLTIGLAFVWLRSSDGAAPQVPAGLSVATLPAQASPDEAVVPARGVEGERAAGRVLGKPRTAEGGERHRRVERTVAPRAKRRRGGRTTKRRQADRVGEAGGQHRPATAPAPSARAGARGTSGATPEFALE